MSVVRMEDYHEGITYMRRIREQGMRAWRVSATLWLCAVVQNKTIWFLSQRGKSEVITKEEAQTYLALV